VSNPDDTTFKTFGSALAAQTTNANQVRLGTASEFVSASQSYPQMFVYDSALSADQTTIIIDKTNLSNQAAWATVFTLWSQLSNPPYGIKPVYLSQQGMQFSVDSGSFNPVLGLANDSFTSTTVSKTTGWATYGGLPTAFSSLSIFSAQVFEGIVPNLLIAKGTYEQINIPQSNLLPATLAGITTLNVCDNVKNPDQHTVLFGAPSHNIVGYTLIQTVTAVGSILYLPVPKTAQNFGKLMVSSVDGTIVLVADDSDVFLYRGSPFEAKVDYALIGQTPVADVGAVAISDDGVLVGWNSTTQGTLTVAQVKDEQAGFHESLVLSLADSTATLGASGLFICGYSSTRYGVFASDVSEQKINYWLVGLHAS
jgi:hypothetical protein